MAKRYIGEAIIEIKYVGTTRDGQEEYRGRVLTAFARWPFDSLYAPAFGFGSGIAYDSATAYDRMAESAISFASYYTTDNRGDDVPDWAPMPETADAICEATQFASDDQGNYTVRRRMLR